MEGGTFCDRLCLDVKKIGMATALETLVKAVRDLDHANSEVHLKDGRIMREVAAVVASADEEQVVLALKVLKKEPCAGGLRGR